MPIINKACTINLTRYQYPFYSWYINLSYTLYATTIGWILGYIPLAITWIALNFFYIFELIIMAMLINTSNA